MLINDVETHLGGNDPRLASLIRADDAGAELEIEQLIVGVAWPLIDRIAWRFTGSRRALPHQDAEDVRAAVSMRLVEKLRRIRSTPGESIQSLEQYVATLTHNVINDHLRRRFPERTRLKNRLRYLLTHDARFDLWNVSGATACGLRQWSGSPDPLASPIEIAAVTRAMRDRDRPGDALQAVFAAVGKPVELQTLANFTAAIWHIVDLVPVDPADANPVVDPVETMASKMERRDFLRALWREIVELRPMQRKALLLNLRERSHGDVLSMLVLTGTAKFDDIAEALELPPDELSALWNKLPLDDLQIATLLDITRQQVINLRKAARTRLQRRLDR